ncbi:MAG: putative Ig domain-containing protein [bacterium]
MKRVIAFAITLLCVACGGPEQQATVADAPGGAPAHPAKGGNEPPEISKATLEPANASANEELKLEVVARDPDRDNLTITVEWYRNGELVEGLDDTTVPPETFARGDRVYAIVYASDGSHEVTRQSAILSVANSAPTVRHVAVTPPRPTALDLLQVEADVQDADGDPYELRYRWLRNGQPLPEADGPRLPPGLGHRAEQLIVQVQATDGSDDSPWVSSPTIVLANAPPAITTQPNYTLSGSGQYSYEVAAKDPDGDRPLKYELSQGPPGMSVDVVSGVVTWHVPADAKGTYPIELAVSDPYGGRTTQRYALAVDWNDTPASPSQSGAVAPAPAAGKAKAKTAPAAKPAKAAPADGDEDYTDEDQGEEPADDEL